MKQVRRFALCLTLAGGQEEHGGEKMKGKLLQNVEEFTKM